MTLLFVHGLGGETGGPLERSLAAAIERHGAPKLVTLRWASGNLQQTAAEVFRELAEEAFFEGNPWRLAVAALVRIQRRGHASWDSALAEATRATQKLVGVLNLLARSNEPYSVVGFSLGGRVLMSALRIVGDPGSFMRRAVFAAAAVPSSSFSLLHSSLHDGKRVINVYSRSDFVLSEAYPFFHGLGGTAGAAATSVAGVRNVEVSVGHLSYGKLAEQLVGLATENTVSAPGRSTPPGARSIP